jgi:Zn-dependent peptidase ImmA (M78 family)/transcriptional regulator with XRE-family HTH domain
MATEAYITPSVLRWARERDNLTTETAADRFDISRERFEAWENGAARPTFRQAQNIAQRLNIPFGYLFLSSPPEERLLLPDLRTMANQPNRQPSPQLLDILTDALAKQEWYREFQQSEGAPRLSFIGRYSLHDNPEAIAADIRVTIGIDEAMRRIATTWEHFLRLFVANVELAGVLVLRSGIVGHNTHRTLSVQEFRGFVISDELAPLIFINARDAKSAQIFTLAHELAHLWIGQSGISNPDYRESSYHQANDVERLCNRVAAETLLPSADFKVTWNRAEPTQVNLQAVATRFRVSPVVALRQAYDNRLLSSEDFRSNYDLLSRRQKAEEPQGEGGDFYNTLFARGSRSFTVALSEALAEGRVSYREAARLLNVKIATLDGIATHLSKLSA